MTIARRIKHAFRGRVSPQAALFEISRHGYVAVRSRYERWALSFERAGVGQVHFSGQFASIPTPKLLEHFRSRSTPRFFSGFEIAQERLAELCRKEFSSETSALLDKAHAIAKNHRWPLLGYGELSFGPNLEWLRDPVSGFRWPSDSPPGVPLGNASGGDARVLWELNRLGHLITLGQAYAVTRDEAFAEEFFSQLEGWRDQNRPGFGPNWNCAMEVALRAMNLVAAFQLLRDARSLTEARLMMMITMLEQHGRYIRSHLEFSYIATSNHYLSDVVGLLWLGIFLPELEEAQEWRAFGLREMLREMDKQILADGAHYESSTGYHRLVMELLLYSFNLCRANTIEIGSEHWEKLRSMVEYLRAYLRPDGEAPLIGDTDSGQVMPITSHTASDHAYLLGVAAVLFNEPTFKISDKPPAELFWLMGDEALKTYSTFATSDSAAARSASFPEVGTFILRNRDMYLLLNASGSGLSGRGAHGHNDVLSLEVSACGTRFLGDPGTYVYTGDLGLRHQFRSTGYHSTVEVDGQEQNTIEQTTPFYIGDNARPCLLSWESTDRVDSIIAEHYGYKTLPNGHITHRRSVKFEKTERYWLIEDMLSGSGRHSFRFCFHIAPGLEVLTKADMLTEIRDSKKNAALIIAALDLKEGCEVGPDSRAHAVVEPRWFSSDYGAKTASAALCLTVEAEAPLHVRWLLVPVCAGEDESARLGLVEHLRQTTI